MLEGKIKLVNKQGKLQMAPGEQVVFDIDKQAVFQQKVRTENAVGWIDGKLIIQNEPLPLAIRKISRWYNVEVKGWAE